MALALLCGALSLESTLYTKVGHGHTQFVQPRVALVICDCTIENLLHYRKNVTLGEDHSHVRTAAAPLVLAALNNAVLSFMDALVVAKVPVQMRVFDTHPQQALTLLLT